MGVKITDMTAAASVAGTELIPTSKAGTPRSVTPEQIKTYVVDEIEAITPGVAVATGNGLFALQGGALKPVDIDLVCQRAIDTVWGKATATPVGANTLPLKASGVEKTVTVTALAETIRGLIEAAILDVSDLSDGSGTLATTDYMSVTHGTTAKRITVQNLYDAIYAGLAAHVVSKTLLGDNGDNDDVLYLVRGTTPKKIKLSQLATFIAGGATLTGSGTAGFLAKWSAASGLTTGPAIVASGSGFTAGGDTEIPTTAAVRGELDSVVNDATDIGASLDDADTLLAYDASAAAQRKSAMSRVWAYVLAKITALTSLVGFGFFVDEDNMASDSAAKVPSQQSVKAYVDTVFGAGVNIDGLAEIGAALADGDELPVYDLSATSNKKTLLSRVWTYVSAKLAAVTDVSSYSWVIDEDSMGSNLATKVPTQQSVKAYVDAAVISGGGYDGNIATLNIDGGVDIGGDLADVDLLVVDDGAAGLNRKCAVSRVKTYVEKAGTYKTIWIPAGAMVPSVTAGATAATIEYATNHQTHDVMVFQGVTADQSAEFSVAMPEAWDRGTVKAKLFWAPGHADANVGEYVGFYLAGGFLRNDDALDSALGTEQLMEDQALADDDMHVSAASGALTLGGTAAAEAMTHWKLRRDFDYAGAGVAMDVNARVLGVLIQYRENNTVAAW